MLFNLVPDFPSEVWESVNALILAVIAGIAVEDAAEKLNKNSA